MSGLSPISSQFTGLAAVFSARARIPALLNASTDYRIASSLLAQPTPDLAANKAIRDLKIQRASIQADVTQNTEFESRLQTLRTGLTTISASLATIKTLVEDTDTNPGNAVANQAAIDNLVANIKNQVSLIRSIEPKNPTFLLTNVDDRISDLALFSADGSRIDTNGINIDINVTNDARRAEIFSLLTDYYLTDALTRIQVTGPGGTSALINLDPQNSQITNAIRNVDRNNTEAVTFQVFGGNHLGTGIDHSAPQLITTVAGTAAVITDAIVGIDPTLNYGDTTISIATETSGGAQNILITGSTQAVVANAVQLINASVNSGAGTFQVGNIDGGGSLQTVNFTGGTQGQAAGVLDTFNSTYYSGATANRTITVNGPFASQNVTVGGGSIASSTAAITGLDARLQFNTGPTVLQVRGTIGNANINLAAGTQATSANFISNLAGNTGGSNSTFDLRVTDSAGTTTANITFNTNQTDINAAVIQLNTEIGGTALAGRITAEVNGGGIRVRSTEYGSGTAVRVLNRLNNTTGGLTLNNVGPTSGTAAFASGQAFRDSLVTQIDGLLASTGVDAFATGTNDIVQLRSRTATNLLAYGSLAKVGIAFVSGDNQSIVDFENFGNDGDDIDDVVTKINAVAATTGLRATNNGGVIDIKAVLTDGVTDAFGSGADVSLALPAGNNIVSGPLTAGNGTGESAATIADNINATTALSRVVATAVGNNIEIKATDAAGFDVFGSMSNVVVVNNAGSDGVGFDFLVANNTDANGIAGDTRDDVIDTINALRYNGGVNPLGVIATAGTTAGSITLTTSSVGTTDVGQRDDDGVIGTGNIEQITVANVITPGPTPTVVVGATTNAVGTNSTSRAELINLINAVNAATEVTATASGTYNITLSSDLLGLGADVNIRPTANPETTAYVAGSVFPNPAAVNNEDISFNVGVGTRQTAYGTVLGISGATTGDGGDTPGAVTFTAIRDEAMLRINTAANPIGVEAFEHDSSNGPTDPAVANDGPNSLSVRSFLFGGAFRVDVTTNGGAATRDVDTVQTNPFDIGEHAVATVVVDGSVAQTLTSTNPGNNPATLSGGNFAFGENGVSVNQFSFNVNGVIGQFSVPVDEIFDPAAVTALQDTSLFLPLVDAQNNFLTRFNFNTLDANFLGEFVFDRNNIGTRGRDGVQGPTVPRGGIKDIDVTTSVVSSLAIINQAIDDVDLDLATATTLEDNLVSPLISSGTNQVAEIDAQRAEIEDYVAALQASQELDAEEIIDSTSDLLAQLSLLYPAATIPLLRDDF